MSTTIEDVMYDMAMEGYRAGNILAELDAKVVKFAMTKRPFTRASAVFQGMGTTFGGYQPSFTGELKPGMVFNIHPWTNPPEADMKANRYHAGHILGETNIVTEGAPECVSKLPNEIIVV